jgi:autotransporter-associated beta strand protein
VFDVPDEFAGLDVWQCHGPGFIGEIRARYVNLQGVNTYTGNTTVSNGTLTINSPLLAATSTVTVNTNGGNN